jgi:hypothetical protein
LGHNQKLQIICPPSVKSSIVSELTIKSILDWVFTNTVSTTERGVVGWAHHGLWHSQRKGERWVDNWEIKEMYSRPIIVVPVETVVSKMTESEIYIPVDGMVEGMKVKRDRILSKISSFAFDLEMISSTADEQCERELQKEAEKEEELEKQAIKVNPNDEPYWDYTRIASCESIGDLQTFLKLIRLASGIAAYCAIDGIDLVGWEQPNGIPIYCTENYFRTVKLTNDGDIKSQCLRPVDVVVCLKDSIMVLVSDREADGILSVLLALPLNSLKVRMLNICRLPERVGIPTRLNSSIPLSIGREIAPPVYNCASIRLFNGCTQFSGAMEELNLIVSAKKAREAAIELVQVRGSWKLYSKSDLEESCNRIR